MRELPIDIVDEDIKQCLSREYGLQAERLIYLDLGADSRAWVYQVSTISGERYFLKVRQSISNPSGLFVAHHLQVHGVADVMAPLPTKSAALWAQQSGYSLILYRFIDGASGVVQGMSQSQWIAYGSSLRRIHGTVFPADLSSRINRETFVPSGVSLVRDIDARLRQERPHESRLHESRLHESLVEDTAVQELTALWEQNRTLIHSLAQQAEDLGSRLAQTRTDFVLCHADIHTHNVMIDSAGNLWIVDWDETLLAPKERDLMFVAGGGISRSLVSPTNEQLFWEGYGDVAINPIALAYYRYAWAIGDIGEFGSEVFLRADLGPQARRTAVEFFKSLFHPGNIVEIALNLRF